MVLGLITKIFGGSYSKSTKLMPKAPVFCKQCGSRLQRNDEYAYDEFTGEKRIRRMYLSCSKINSFHPGYVFRHDKSQFSKFLGRWINTYDDADN